MGCEASKNKSMLLMLVCCEYMSLYLLLMFLKVYYAHQGCLFYPKYSKNSNIVKFSILLHLKM